MRERQSPEPFAILKIGGISTSMSVVEGRGRPSKEQLEGMMREVVTHSRDFWRETIGDPDLEVTYEMLKQPSETTT